MRALRATLLLAPVLAAASPQTETLPSGLIIETLSGPVTCDRPTRAHDKIAVHYKGTLLSNGEEFDESYKRGQPFQFTLGVHQVISGWDQGLLDMCIGQSRKLTIPSDLAYGDRGAGSIPPKATLVFETKLMNIVEFSKDPDPKPVKVTSTTTPTETTAESTAVAAIQTAPAEAETEETNSKPDKDKSPNDKPPKQAHCHLLGPFALFAQGALGALALLTLVVKRWREVPRRPWRIFFFDVSKQVFGSMLTHVINLFMSMVGAGGAADAAAVVAAAASKSGDGRTPNPCSFYLLNLGIDTTLGVPVLYVLLKVLTRLFLLTPLANPPQSIKSGNYGQPAKWSWYFKQLLIYCIGLVGMKLFVFFLFMAMPFLPWIGDWALRWTEGSEALQVAFALFIFPLAMNALQYYIIDSFIMDRTRGSEGHGGEYSRVQEEEEGSGRGERYEEDGDTLGSEDVHVIGKDSEEVEDGLREVEPEPIEAYADDVDEGGRSGK